MKIVDTDNFGSDYPDEKFVAEGITDERLGKLMCKGLNSDGGEDSPRYYKLVPDDYILQPGFEP